MAITLSCPRCTHKNTFDDAKVKQPVHCRICHHLLTANPGVAPASPAAAPVPAPAEGLVKEGLPPVAGRGASTQPPSRRATQDEETERRSSRRPPPRQNASMLGWIFGGVGAVLLLGCCAGAPVLYLLAGRGGADVPVAVIDPPPENVNPIPFDNRAWPLPPPVVVVPPPPVVLFQPPPVIVPPPAPLDPRNPAEVHRALAGLAKPGPERDAAIRWLKEANPNNPRRSLVAQTLEPMVEQQKRVAWSNDHFFAAYFRWATKENFPSLLTMVEDKTFAIDQNHRRQKAMATFGKLQDARGADAIIPKLGNIFDGAVALRAMQDMGPAGDPALLKHMNHPDGNVRGQVRGLLTQHKIAADTQLTQAVADLSADDEPVRNAALDWLGQAPVIEGRRPEVSRALEPLITRSVQGPLLKALETWGTADNGLAVAQNLDGNVFVVRNQLTLLGKLRDPRTIPFLAARITRFAQDNEARAALKQFGNAAEPEVVKLLGSPDRNVRVEACRLLGDVGTRKLGIPAILAAAQAQANDRQFAAVATTSVNRINGRDEP